jgi:hypothetical protein
MSPLFADHLNSLVLFQVKLGPPSANVSIVQLSMILSAATMPE